MAATRRGKPASVNAYAPRSHLDAAGHARPEWVMEQWPGSATILAVRCKGIREGKPFDETHY